MGIVFYVTRRYNLTKLPDPLGLPIVPIPSSEIFHDPYVQECFQ